MDGDYTAHDSITKLVLRAIAPNLKLRTMSTNWKSARMESLDFETEKCLSAENAVGVKSRGTSQRWSF
jgi:hypothetical protein